MKNLLLIDSAVQDFTTFLNSVNADTIPFVYSSTTTREDVLDFIGEATIDRLGIVFYNTGLFLGEPFYYEFNTAFFLETIRQCQVKHIDFLACNTLREERWKTFYDNLHYETGVIVGASDNPTGNLKYGGDWLLESTSEDIELVYFTNTIQYYKFLLDYAYYTMIVKNDGTIWGTGDNSSRQLGDGTSVSKSAFFNITAFQSSEFQSKTVKQLSNGTNHAVVLMTDNTLWFTGFLGIDPINRKFTKINLSFSDKILYIDSGWYSTVLYTNVNTLWGCGSNNYGQLGLPQATTSVSTFTQLSGFTGTIKAIACSISHTIVLTTSNKLWVTGSNTYGQLGVGNTTNRYSFNNIVNIDTLSGRIPDKISASFYNSYVTMTDGTIWTAGYGACLGRGPVGDSTTFVQASNINNYYNGSRKVKQITTGIYHNVILMTDGTLWGIGNSGGELGIGSTLTINYYTQITIPTIIKSIYASVYFTIVLGFNNNLYVLGGNEYGQLGIIPLSTMIFVNALSDVNLLPCDLYNQNPTLFTDNTNMSVNTLLSEMNLKNSDTSILQIGSVGTTTNLSGTVNGITVSSSDNSSQLSTTAFVKGQTSVYTSWSALQTFSSGILSFAYDALTPSSTLSVGSNLTTGIMNIGTSLNPYRTVNIGTSTSITNISNMSCNNLSCQTIEPMVQSGTFGIGANQMTGQLLVGDGLNRTANMYVGNRIIGPGALSLGASITNASILIGSNSNGPGLSTISIGNTYTTTNLRGDIQLYNPITIGYSIPGQSLASLAYIGGAYTVNSRFVYDITTVTKAQAPINNIPTGRYCLSMYVYVTAGSVPALYTTKLAYNSTAITANSTTGFNTSTLDILETYTYKQNNTNAITITPSAYYDVVAGNNNIAIACSTTSNSNGTCVFIIRVCRVA